MIDQPDSNLRYAEGTSNVISAKVDDSAEELMMIRRYRMTSEKYEPDVNASETRIRA